MSKILSRFFFVFFCFSYIDVYTTETSTFEKKKEKTTVTNRDDYAIVVSLLFIVFSVSGAKRPLRK